MATTVNTPNVGTAIFRNKLNQVTRAQASNPAKPLGLFEFDSGSVTAATTQCQQDDEIFVYTFPDNCRLVDLVYITSDRDSGTALVEDVIVEDSAGTEIVLINDATTAQAGGTALIDTAKKFTDCSNMKLGVRVAVSATTAVAGTVRFKGIISVGKTGYGLVSSPASVPA